MGCYGRDAESVGGFPELGGPEDRGYDISAHGGRRVVVPSSGWCTGGRGDMENRGIHSGTAGHHRGASGLPAYL